MPTLILTLLTLISAFLHIRAEYHGPRKQVYIFKPLTTILILLNAVQLGWADPSLHKYAILAGLAFSLAGDVFLMLPSDHFIAGLVSFLIGHIFYIMAFTSGTGFSFSLLSLLPFAIYGVVMFTILAPHTGKMKLPVSAYIAVILIMVWQACARWGHTGGTGRCIACLRGGSTLRHLRLRASHEPLPRQVQGRAAADPGHVFQCPVADLALAGTRDSVLE